MMCVFCLLFCDFAQEGDFQIAERIIELCMKELFEFRMMQTDPNWTNFLWNGRTRQVLRLLHRARRSLY